MLLEDIICYVKKCKKKSVFQTICWGRRPWLCRKHFEDFMYKNKRIFLKPGPSR